MHKNKNADHKNADPSSCTSEGGVPGSSVGKPLGLMQASVCGTSLFWVPNRLLGTKDR